jgi:hypothetical protein
MIAPGVYRCAADGLRTLIAALLFPIGPEGTKPVAAG